ncbi:MULTISPECIES: ParA family protein [unclassified Streptomyces]|uniref:ParA family protein n=1 Tax=unclassified Streptomyces TaxID=2593676 RepID=UPI00226FFAB4|nr:MULTISPECIES: ParA family protein [unclassified Streptomyces]MCY0923562.1 ParA family protein [Streptomyces sp. H27-G5]MCY0962011.1 ParA family protein [Streptomyces sp. H27-H5]
MSPSQRAAVDTAARRAKVISFFQQKGGAGKSTDAVNVAAVMGENNPPESPDAPCPVVAAGIDLQGSLEKWARKVPEDRLPFDYLITRGELGKLRKLIEDPDVLRVIVDTPGFADIDPNAEIDAIDPLGKGPAAEAMREVLDLTDLALVPIVPVETLTHDPAEFTIERLLKPRNIPFRVVINNWDSGTDRTRADLREMQEWCTKRGYKYMSQPIRRYKLHAQAPAKGLTVIQYPESGTSLRAREDFYKLALGVEGLI